MSSSGRPYPDQPPEAAPADRRPGRVVSTGQILAGLLLVLVVVFIVENSRQVTVRLIVPEVKAPLYVTILVSAVLGALIAWLLRLRRHRNHPPR